MGTLGRLESKIWWREGEYIPKNSKWLLECLQGVYGTVEAMVHLIDEADTESPANRAEIRDSLVEKMKEMCQAYFILVEQHDRLVGANSNNSIDSSKLSDQQKPSSPPVNQETEIEAKMNLQKENEIENVLSQYNGLGENLQNIESELSKTKNDLAKKEEMLFNSERLNYQKKSNLESLRQKVELQEKELKQKREEIERIKPKLSEMEMHKSNLDNKMSGLEREITFLNIQKVSYEEKISNLLKDLSLLNESKENIEKKMTLHLRGKEKVQSDMSSRILESNIQKISYEEKISKLLNDFSLLKEINENLEQEVALHLREKEKIQSDMSSQILESNIQKVSYEEKISILLRDLSLLNENKESLEKNVTLHSRDKEKIQSELFSQISEASKVNATHKAQLLKYKLEKKILSEKIVVLENTLSKTNIEFEALKEKILALQRNIKILTHTITAYMKKNNNREVSLSTLEREPEFFKAKSDAKGRILQNLIVEKQTIFTQIHLLEEQIKKLNETLEHTVSTNLDDEHNITSFIINIERFNVDMPSFGVVAYHFLISMHVWKEVDVFLNKMPVWRKMRDQVEGGIDGLKEGLGTIKSKYVFQMIRSLAGKIFRFSGTMKYYLVKYIRVVLCFYNSFFAARFLSKRGTTETDSSHSNSEKDSGKIKDGIDVDLKETEKEILRKRKEVFKKIAELRQQEFQEQIESK